MTPTTYLGAEKSNKAHRLFGSHILSLIALDLNLCIPILITSRIQNGVEGGIGSSISCVVSCPIAVHLFSPTFVARSITCGIE
jgi:hypothetical protein